MEDILVLEQDKFVKFPLVHFAICLLHLQLLVQGSFHQEEVKQAHCRDTQRPYIMNKLGPPEAPNHLPLATLPCLPEQFNHCGKNMKRGAHMLAPGSEGVKGRFVREIILLLDGISVAGQSTREREGSPL